MSTDHVVVNQNVPLVSQQQISVEIPANADVVTLQVGSSLRRTDKQKDSGLLLAIVDTVTLNRKTALAVSDDTHAGGSVQKPRAVNDENPPTAMPLRHDGLSYRFPFHTEKQTYPYFDPIAQKAFDANYDGRGRRQRADHVPVHPERRLQRRRQAGGPGRVPVAVDRRRGRAR